MGGFPIGTKPLTPYTPPDGPKKPVDPAKAEAKPEVKPTEAKPEEATGKAEGTEPEKGETEPLIRTRFSNHTELPKDIDPAFSRFNLGVDLGIERRFGGLYQGEKRGKLELFATPGFGLDTHGKTNFNLSLNAGTEYLFRNNLLLGGETGVGVRFPHDEKPEFFNETRGTVGYQFDLGKGVKLTPQLGAGYETNFTEFNPFVTAGGKLEKGRHEIGANIQYGGSQVPVSANLTYTFRLFK